MNRTRLIKDSIQDFITSFDNPVASKIFNSLEILDELGEKIRPPMSKKVTKGVYELRIISDLSVRILYTFHKDEIWILHAFVKKSQKIPVRELKIAVNRLSYL